MNASNLNAYVLIISAFVFALSLLALAVGSVAVFAVIATVAVLFAFFGTTRLVGWVLNG